MSEVRKLATKKTAVQVTFSGCAFNYSGYIFESIAAVDEGIMHMGNRPGKNKKKNNNRVLQCEA